ncbi:nitric oxide-associated protein 1 [Agrilus planipennis]|uniref:Nitric oxide-associated protein 1 n=1 Tax=Agrilus planipennis TaxID=224129 RepID=A0A7F5RLQ7_AGRPL|nr:nitric oxide-associated protein 1 [Agrilus planipennis]
MLFIIKNCHKIKQQIICKVCRLQHSTQLKGGSTESPRKNVEELIKKLDKKILFSSYMNVKYSHLKFTKGKTVSEKLRHLEEDNLKSLRFVQPLPVYLKYRDGEQEDLESSKVDCSPDVVQFPFSVTHTEIASDTNGQPEDLLETEAPSEAAISEVKKREELLKERKQKWMSAYENYPYDLMQEQDEIDDDNSFTPLVNYGTPDPKSRISKIPCGGCGAFLHCKDASIPGYIPSEIFKTFRTHEVEEIRSIVCQRCYFLKEFNTALQVRVSPDEYPKVLEVIRREKALILLLIDLLDFPCSIWPGITDIIGRKKPVMIIGNKVDLLPSDSSSYLTRIKTVLTESVKEMGLEATNVVHTALISALTGWGVEELITKIHSVWGTKGDIYLVGCTNVGKSSLFNVLLQSDFCKVKASDLIHRATTSCWPGTTLNLLKFPILRPSGWRLYVRTKRLNSSNRIAAMERRLRKEMLKQTRNPKYATLIGHIDKTFSENGMEKQREFSSPEQMGIDATDPEYAMGKWCYDTPGVVRPDQIIHLLTTEELTKTLPKKLIRPYTIRVKQNSTVFIAGLARLDYLKGPDSVLLTIFRSEHLPITVCKTEDAEELYETFVGTEMLSVPEGTDQRLREWPGLKAGDSMTIDGIHWDVSCGDIVLSNAGWITVTFGGDVKAEFKPWTPEARGIFLRKSLLPFAVTLRGKKIRRSLAYTSNKIFIE